MRRTIPFALVALVALVALAAFAAGWVVRGERANRPAESVAPPPTAVRTIAVHIPDPAAPDRTTYHILRVFRVGTAAGEVDVGPVSPGNWSISTLPGDDPVGKGRVTYYASPVP